MIRKNIARILVFVLIVGIAAGDLFPRSKQKNKQEDQKRQRTKKKNLDKKYKDWLDLVHYIITPTEKKVFFKLTNNRDRDSFINLFWKLRDPTKGTPENEFRTEHIKRFHYANRYFRFDSPRPGWQNDRGKIYIVLGPPISRNEVIKNELRPVEIWEYFGGPEKGLPTAFRVVFYKRDSMTGYKLYIPVVDGPASLLTTWGNSVDLTDNYAVWSKIYEIEPAVGDVALTLIPGESVFNNSPSMQDPLLMAKIYEYPKRKINATYAKNFLNYKGIVETSVTTNYIDASFDLYTLRNPELRLNFLHYAIRPEQISVDYSRDSDKYYFNFNLMVLLKKGEDVVLQYNKNYPFYYEKNELDTKLSNGIVITDYCPVIEGEYKFVAVLQNSTNKEISYFEKNLNIGSVEITTPRLFGPLVSYNHHNFEQAGYSSFNILGRKAEVDPKQIFGLSDSLAALFYVDSGKYNKKIHVELEVECRDEGREYFKKYSYNFPTGKKFHAFSQDLEKLKYGFYTLKTKVLGEKGAVLDSAEKEFQVSPRSTVAHPPMAGKLLRPGSQYLFYMAMAGQYWNTKDYSKAEAYYRKAMEVNSSSPGLIKSYCSFLLEQKKYDRVLEIVENIKDVEKEAFHYYALKGRAQYYKEQYETAVSNLLEANKIYDSDVTVLNTLGFALLRTDQREEAVRALSASLRINSHQQHIVDIVDKLKKEGKKSKPKK